MLKNVDGTTWHYIWHGDQLTHVINADGLHFYYDGTGRLSHMTHNGTWYGYLFNLQGDIIGIVDTSGNLVVEYKYDAWGKVLSITGSKAGTVGQINPFRYRGYLYDNETGLYYLKSRYYNPEWGRFISADVVLGKTGELLGHNLYCYCENNIVNCYDPNGCIDLTINGAHALDKANTKGDERSGGAGGLVSLGLAYTLSLWVGGIVALVSSLFTGNSDAADNPLIIEKELAKIAIRYGIGNCDKAAKAMNDYLSRKGKKCVIVTIKYYGPHSTDYIYSLSLDRAVGDNRMHQGVKYGEKIYCVVHPYGLPVDIWLADFIGDGVRKVDPPGLE